MEFLQPFGVLANARIDGEHFANSSGAGDTTLAASVWLMKDKAARRYLGLTLYLVVPDVAYDRRETINLGGNRMVYDPELAFHQGFNDRWSFDLSADLLAYGDNTNAGSATRQTSSERPTVQLQYFLNCLADASGDIHRIRRGKRRTRVLEWCPNRCGHQLRRDAPRQFLCGDAGLPDSRGTQPSVQQRGGLQAGLWCHAAYLVCVLNGVKVRRGTGGCGWR